MGARRWISKKGRLVPRANSCEGGRAHSKRTADARVSLKQGNSKRAKNKTPKEILAWLWSQKGGLSEGTTCQMDQVRRLKTGVMSGAELAEGKGKLNLGIYQMPEGREN